MDYSKDELEAPKWLNEEFLEKVLKANEGHQNLKLIDYTIAPAVAKGNHFASIMFRANVQYNVENDEEIRNESFIIKAMPEIDGFKKDFLDGTQAFDTELHMYTETIPYMEKELKKYGLDTAFGPRIIYHELQPSVLVLQDLKVIGYEVMNDGWLNFDNYKLALNKLVKMHAVSFKINAGDNFNVVQYFKNRSFAQTIPSQNSDHFINGLELFQELLKSIPELNEYVEKYENVKGTLINDICESHSCVNSKVNVLNHGDFHLKNLLFMRNEIEKIENVLFVDFQFSVWGSPAIDLIYSMYTMLNPELRLSKRNEIINYYYNSFVSTLKKLDFKGDIPSFEDLQIDIDKMKSMELFLFTTITPFMYQIASGDVFDEDDLAQCDGNLKNTLRNPKYIEDVKRSYPWYFQQGYFEHCDNNNNN